MWHGCGMPYKRVVVLFLLLLLLLLLPLSSNQRNQSSIDGIDMNWPQQFGDAKSNCMVAQDWHFQKRNMCTLEGDFFTINFRLGGMSGFFSVVGFDPEKMPSTSSYPLKVEYPALSVITIAIPRMDPRKKTDLTLLGKVERKFQRKNAQITILVLRIDYRYPTIEVFFIVVQQGPAFVKKIVHQNMCQTILTGRNDTCSKESGCGWSHS